MKKTYKIDVDCANCANKMEDAANKMARPVRFCDFASAGNDWASKGRYKVWIPQTLHMMTEPYRKY